MGEVWASVFVAFLSALIWGVSPRLSPRMWAWQEARSRRINDGIFDVALDLWVFFFLMCCVGFIGVGGLYLVTALREAGGE